MNMQSTELQRALEDLRLSPADAARLLKVTGRAVGFWLSGEREVPGPVAAYLSLMLSLPAAQRDLELARLREDVGMYEGMYGVVFEGQTGSGTAVFVLERGQCYGSDGGVQYDGAYEAGPRPGLLNLRLKLTVPAGVELVSGYPVQPVEYRFDISATITGRGNSIIQVAMPYGSPVNAHVTYLRDIPRQ